MASIKSLKADIEVVVPGGTSTLAKETTKKGSIEILENSGDVLIKFPLGSAARKQLIDVLVKAENGVKAHIVDYVDGADI